MHGYPVMRVVEYQVPEPMATPPGILTRLIFSTESPSGFTRQKSPGFFDEIAFNRKLLLLHCLTNIGKILATENISLDNSF